LQIILISDRLAKARSVTLSLRHLLGSAFLVLALVLASTAGVYWLSLRYASEVPVPALHRLILAAQEAETERNHAFVQQNLLSSMQTARRLVRRSLLMVALRSTCRPFARIRI